jgi:alpha-L-fucosidase
VITLKDKTIFAHVLKKTSGAYIFIPGVQQKVKSVISFSDKKALRFKQQPEGLFVYTDGLTWDDIDTIIQIQ